MSFELPNLDAFVDVALRSADAARASTLKAFRNGTSVEEKGGPIFDPVTAADRDAEAAMRAVIEKACPDHAILGEEFGEKTGDADWRWVLDPIDGTRAFICGVPSWTSLIALEYRGAPVLGLIDQPCNDERWVAYDGRAEFIAKGVRRGCQTSGLEVLSQARVSTTDPRADQYFSKPDAAAFGRLCAASRLARFSLDGYAYGLLALGELDVVAETGLQPYDYAALAPVVEGAGGVVSNWSGGALGSDGRGEILAAASPALHRAVLETLKSVG